MTFEMSAFGTESTVKRKRAKGKDQLRVTAPYLKGLQSKGPTLAQIDVIPQNLVQSWTFAATGSGEASHIKAGANLCFCMSVESPIYVRNNNLSLVLRHLGNSP